ncbi:MAG: hypothetical protein QM817_31700 [Archangium sp.]
MTIRTIQNGTTLGKMVAAHNREFKTTLTVDQVAKANGLQNVDKIQAGGKLLFPDKFETNAPTSVIKNAEGGKTQRNGVKEQVDVKMGPDAPITTEPGKISTTIQNRPLEKLPEAPKTKQPELISTEAGKVSTTIQNRPLEKLPEAPKTKQPELISTEAGKVSTTIQNRPLEKLPEAPKTKQPELISTEAGKVSTTVQNRPLEKLPEPPVKTTLSLSEFLAANKDQKLSVDSLRRKGVNAASSDLNGDGVIAGANEQTSLFRSAEKADKQKDDSADLTNTTVAKNFDRIGSAQRLKVAPYTSLDLSRVKETLTKGTAERLMTVNPDTAKYLGLSPGSTEFTVSTPIDETRDMGNRNNNVTIYRDAKTGQYFKEYNNDADKKNTPMVPLTAAEKKLLTKLNPSEISGNTDPNTQKMFNELFGRK